ncbi:MAG: phage tail protein [Bryobacteraceae bacterium]|jgi:phage tail-like protein
MGTGFTKNATRIDPYKNYKFQVKWDGHTVLGVMKAGPLKRTTNVITHRSGQMNSTDHKTPGRTQYDGVVFERGITWDLDFEAWANKVHPFVGDSSMDLVNFRKELVLEVLDEKGLVARRFFLHGCWVSEYTASPQLDSSGNAIAIESIKIELEGWERDPQSTEQDESQAVPQSS